MNCTQTQDWLYEADAGAEPPAGVAAHLQTCAGCRELAERIGRLEADWRALPAPAMCEGAKRRVLAAVLSAAAAGPPLVEAAKPRAVASRKATAARRRWIAPSWLIAGAVLVAAAIGFYAWGPSSEAQASPDALDRILDVNVALAEADPADRAKLYGDAQASLNAELASGDLAPDDLAMAKTLVDNANWLSKNGDPVAEAERLATVADQLLARLQTSVRAKKAARVAKAAKQYADADRAALNCWDDAEKAGASDPAQASRLTAVIRQNLKRQESFEALMLSATRPELEAIQKAADPGSHPHKGHNKHHKKPQHTPPSGASA